MEEIRVVNIVPQDIHMILDLPVKQLRMLKLLLDKMDIEYNRKTEPDIAEAVDFLNEVLYPFLVKVDKEEFGEI